MGVPSTLNIPAKLLRRLRRETKLSLRSLLTRLLIRPARLKRRLARRQSIYIGYQDRGLRLIPVSFRPMRDDWAMLGCLAMSMGYSRCVIFCALLEEYLAKGVGGIAVRVVVGALVYRDSHRMLRILLRTRPPRAP